MPKRLIDIRGNSQMLQLIETIADSGSLMPYAALSYCWGPEPDARFQFKTVDETLSECMTTGFNFDKMPTALKDAVTISRALNIPYLWIDSICIIQGNSADWQEQCGQMGDVYGMATVTLVAASSTTCREGFLSARTSRNFRYACRSQQDSPDVEGGFVISFRGHCEHPGDSYYGFSNVFQRDSGLCQWARRGWTFQESLVSPRKIIFGSEDVHFVNQGTVTSRSGGNAQDTWNDFAQLDTRAKCHSSWRQNMQVYSRFTAGSFTHFQDLLPALSGLARRFGTLLPQETYLAGHWSGDLDRSLMWRPSRPFRRDLDLIDQPEIQRRESGLQVVPSWSCLSRGAVIFVLYSEEYGNITTDVRFVDFPLKLATQDPYGALLDCRICLEGSMMDLSKLTWSESYDDSVVIGSVSDGLGHILIDSHKSPGDDGSVLSVMIESRAGQKWTLDLNFDQSLPGRRKPYWESESAQGLLHSVESLIPSMNLLILGRQHYNFPYGLIVDSIGDQDGLFQRVGYFKFKESSCRDCDNARPFSGEMVQRRRITLI